VNAGGGEGHWLDRLAVRHTRRHTFKATLAAAAFTLPLLRSTGRARAAEDAHACYKGCIYTSQREYRAADTACKTEPVYESLYLTMFTGYLGLARLVKDSAIEFRCWDKALLEKADRDISCTGPGCPGFDPASQYGPCRNCASINGCQCCPDASAPSGYTYCSSLSNYCCGPSGGCVVCGT
jgi:hypothetical protein